MFRAVCTVFNTWLSDYPEDFRSLDDPSCLLRLAPLFPTDPSGTEIKDRLLRIAEELSEKTLLSGSLSGQDILRCLSSTPAEFSCCAIFASHSAGHYVAYIIRHWEINLHL